MGKIAAPKGTYEAKRYWQERLASDFTLAGVGCMAYGEAYNRWLYRAFLRNLEWAERRFGFDLSASSILECGFGTGFFLDYYHRRGNRNFAGVDLTEVSVANVHKRYPQADLRQADLGAGPLDMGKRFDIATAFAVLLHITDDDNFRQAMANLCNHAEQFVLISDVFPNRRYAAPGKSHFVLRSRAEYEAELAKHGFEILGTEPIFALLHYPKPSPGWFFYLWNRVLYTLCLTGLTARAFGGFFYWLDGILLGGLHFRGSMRLLVARRKSPPAAAQ